MARKRLIPLRPNGRFNKRAPFWRGERAEDIVFARKREYRRQALRKRRSRRRRNAR